MKLRARAVVFGTVVGGLLAIVLHVASANPRRRHEVRSADGLVTLVRL
ncbi:MAG: hypothetical protein WA622_27440 [Mycobacterium sp.]